LMDLRFETTKFLKRDDMRKEKERREGGAEEWGGDCKLVEVAAELLDAGRLVVCGLERRGAECLPPSALEPCPVFFFSSRLVAATNPSRNSQQRYRQYRCATPSSTWTYARCRHLGHGRLCPASLLSLTTHGFKKLRHRAQAIHHCPMLTKTYVSAWPVALCPVPAEFLFIGLDGWSFEGSEPGSYLSRFES
jgi:hypothetical protein